MRGEPTILPSLLEFEERGGDAVLNSLPLEDGKPEAWLTEELGIGATWLTGLAAGPGLLGALLCEMVALEAGPEETLGEGLVAGAGGGLLGALLVEECCANTAEENSKITATTRLESRMTHLLPTEPNERWTPFCFDVCRQVKDISESCQRA
jgi:hypothetical protein